MARTARIKVTREVPDLSEQRVELLKNFFPEVVSEGRIDSEKLLAMLSGRVIEAGPERFSFSWAGKRNATQILQMPTRATLVPDQKGSVNFQNAKNLFIEGDNLEVMKLLYKAYFGSIKMIYIDPPYNTGKEFVYSDDYSDPLEAYLKITNQKDEAGNLLTTNVETGGRFHSAWLSMMYPRLFLARNLLKEDGLIVVSIDDNEVHNLKMIMNEIFGEENFIAQICIVSNPRGRQSDRFVATVNEYIIIYAKDASNSSLSGAPLTAEQMSEFKHEDEKGRKYRLLGLRQRGVASRRQDRPDMFYPIYVNPRTQKLALDKSKDFPIEVLPKKSTGEDGRWMWGKKKTAASLEILETRLISGRNEWDIFVRDYLTHTDGQERTRKFKTVWDDKELNYQNGTMELKDIFGFLPIDYPKPVSLLRKIITMAGDSDDEYFMDFFAGSSTTGHAVLEMNKEDRGTRRFIMVQLPEPTPKDSAARKEGYKTIAEIGAERLRRVLKHIKSNNARLDDGLATKEDNGLGFKLFKLEESNYKNWKGIEEKTPEKYVEAMQSYIDPLKEGWQLDNVLHEILIKEGFMLTSVIEKEERCKDNRIWSITDAMARRKIMVSLDDKIKNTTIRNIGISKDDLFVCRDSAVDDTAAANLALNCRLKTI